MTFTYKPIDDTNLYEELTQQYFPVPVSMVERVYSNGQFSLRNRLAKTCLFWTGGPTDITADATWVPDDILGYYNPGLYYDNAGTATAGSDPETSGLQFSTHIADPYVLTVPISLPFGKSSISYSYEEIKVRICAKIENADVHVLAWLTNTPKETTKQINRFMNMEREQLLDATALQLSRYEANGFIPTVINSEITCAALQVMTPTATTANTDGCSYYELLIPSQQTLDAFYTDRPAPGSVQNSNPYGNESELQQRVYINLAFLSTRYNLLNTSTIDSTLPFPDKYIVSNDIGSGAYITLSDKYNAKYGTTKPPGKFHGLIKINYDGGGYTYHHTLMHIPVDPTKTRPHEDIFTAVDNPWDNKYHSTFALYPSIPFEKINEGLVGAGDTVQVYTLGKVTLFSVTAEPSLEVPV